MPNNKLSKNSIALAGEFAVLSQLALRGFDANLTLGNTKGVDILVSDPNSRGMYRLEVKTSAKGASKSAFWGHHLGWTMSQSHETIDDPLLFYCFVRLATVEGKALRFFIVPSHVVAGYVRDQHALWLSADPKRKDTSMRQFRLALAEEGYPLQTPAASQYEDNWLFEQAGHTRR
jgi:hypothetical protein